HSLNGPVRMLRKQFLRISVSFFHLLEAGDMPFLQNRFRIRFHSGGKRERKKGFSIVGICFLALPGKFAGAGESVAKMVHAPRIRTAVNPMQEFLFVQEKIAGQYALPGELLKEIAGGDGDLTKRLLRIAGFPAGESLTCFGESLLVEQIESSAKLWYGREGRRLDAWRFPSKIDDRAQQQ